MGRAAVARKANALTERLPGRPSPTALTSWLFRPVIDLSTGWLEDHYAGTARRPMRLKCWRGFQGPDHENALERWSPRARYNCLRESRVRHGSGRNQLHLYLAHARRNTEATTRNGASSSAATPRRQTPKTTPPRPRRKGSGSSPSARVATTGGQLGKTNSGAALGARNSLRDWSVGQFNRSRCPGPSGGSKVKPAWPPRLLPDLPTGDVELIEHLLRHYVLVDIGDLLAQAADQL